MASAAGGAAGGATYAALSGGGLQGIVMGAVTGGALGAATGGLLMANVPGTVLLAAGAGISVAQDGLDGLAYYAGGVLGGYVGFKGTPYVENWVQGYGFDSNNTVISNLAREGRYQDAIDFASRRYPVAPGKWDPSDPAFKPGSMTIAKTSMLTGEVKYGPLSFSEESMLQSAGFHEGVHVSQYESNFKVGSNLHS